MLWPPRRGSRRVRGSRRTTAGPHRGPAAGRRPGAPTRACARGLLTAPSSARGGARSARRRRAAPKARAGVFLTLPVRARASLEDGQRADGFVVNEERDEERPADAALLDDPLEAGETRIAPQVLDEQEAAAPVRAKRQREQPLGQLLVRSRQTSCGPRDEAALLTEVDGDLSGGRELGHALDRGVERVRERELRDRLADDGDERLRALERSLDLSRAPAASEREPGVGPNGESGRARAPPPIRVEGKPQGGRQAAPRGERVQSHDPDRTGAGLAPGERAPDALGRLHKVGRRPPKPWVETSDGVPSASSAPERSPAAPAAAVAARKICSAASFSSAPAASASPSSSSSEAEEPRARSRPGTPPRRARGRGERRPPARAPPPQSRKEGRSGRARETPRPGPRR